MTRRRNTASTSRALDPTRARRASQAAAVGQVAGEGMGVDPSGRLESRLGQGFFKDGDGVWQIRVRAPLHLAPGSPRALTIDLSSAVSREILAAAEPTSDDVKGLDDDDTITATLNRFEAAFLAGDVTLQAALDVLAAAVALKAAAADVTTLQGQVATLQAQVPLGVGLVTLVGGTKAVTLASVGAGAVVILTAKTLLGTVGQLSYTVTAGVGFTINSLSALDVSVVGYVAWNP